MVNIKEKIRRFFYPFEKPLTVVVVGNDPAQSGRLVQQIKAAILSPNGYFTHIQMLECGSYQNEEGEEVYYFKLSHSLLAFTLHVAVDMNTVYAQKGKTGIDLLISSLSFSHTAPHIHDETDKYEIGAIIQDSKLIKIPRVSVMVINHTLLRQECKKFDKIIMCDQLRHSLFERNFPAAVKYLNEKGNRQLENIMKEQLGNNSGMCARAKVQAKTIILYNAGASIENIEHLFAFFLSHLFKRNKWSNYAIY